MKQKQKVHVTRNTIKKLNELMGNSKFSEYLMANTAMKIPKHLPKDLYYKLNNNYMLMILNSTIILPFQGYTKGTVQVVSQSQSQINIQKVIL